MLRGLDSRLCPRTPRANNPMEAYNDEDIASVRLPDEFEPQPVSPPVPAVSAQTNVPVTFVVLTDLHMAVDGDTAYLVNSRTEVHAVPARDAHLRWRGKMPPDTTPMSLATARTPALYGEPLVIPAKYESAVDRPQVARTLNTNDSDVNVAHNTWLARSVSMSLAVRDVICIVGADSVPAVGMDSWSEQWRTQLGDPILREPTAADDVLFESNCDGTVQALVHGRSADASRRVGAGRFAGVMGGSVLVVVYGGLIVTRRYSPSGT